MSTDCRWESDFSNNVKVRYLTKSLIHDVWRPREVMGTVGVWGPGGGAVHGDGRTVKGLVTVEGWGSPGGFCEFGGEGRFKEKGARGVTCRQRPGRYENTVM